MKLIKIGDLVEVYNEKCNISNLTINDVYGINKDKEFFSPTIQVGKDTSNYKVVPQGYFAANLMHVGRDFVIPIAYNNTPNNIIVSPAYSVFKIIKKDIILDDYFFMIQKKIDFDRYAAFCTDSSIRDGLEWGRFLDIEIMVPSIENQIKVVKIYNAMVENQKTYELSLEILRFTTNAFIDKLKKDKKVPLLEFLEEIKIQNSNNEYSKHDVMGVSKTKEIIITKAKIRDNDLSKFIIVPKNGFVYNPRSADAIAINTNNDILISWNNTAFKIMDHKLSFLNPKYLNLWFSRDEYSRWAKFNSWGSSTEVLSFEEIKNYKIPIPSLKVQNSIVSVFDVYEKRRRINDKLKQLINEICPILIKGSLNE